jgi:hypothetical protein
VKAVVLQWQAKKQYQKQQIQKQQKEFGQIGVVSIRQKFKSKWKGKGIKMIMVGYAAKRSADIYQMYNPTMKKIIRPHNVSG